MRIKLFLAAATASTALAAGAAPAGAQTYAQCGAGQIPSPSNPYYCIPDTDPNPPVGGKQAPRVSLKVKPKRDRSAPIRYRASGKVRRPSGVSRAAGCKGRVRVQVRRGKRVVASKNARVKRNCNYSTKVKVRGGRLKARGKLKVRARFLGNTRLRARNSKTVRVRYVK